MEIAQSSWRRHTAAAGVSSFIARCSSSSAQLQLRWLCWPQGANANFKGVSGLMGGPGSAGSVMPVVQQKLQKMVQTNRWAVVPNSATLLLHACQRYLPHLMHGSAALLAPVLLDLCISDMHRPRGAVSCCTFLPDCSGLPLLAAAPAP